MYYLSVECKNNSLSQEELITKITNLRAGSFVDVAAGLAIIAAIIILANNANGFQPNPQVNVSPHLQWLYGNNYQSGQRNSDLSTSLTAHDGFEAKLTDKSASHLTAKHGDVLGIDDPLSPNPNQKLGKYSSETIRTRINRQNKKQTTGTLEKILKDINTEVFPGVSIRGFKGHGYYTEDYGPYGFFVGIHAEGEFEGLIMKAQPVTPEQLEYLRTLNSIN